MSAERSLRGLSDTELQAMVTAFERALFAGTSSHRDVVALIEAEHEIMRREAKRARRTVHEERRARTLSGAEAGGWLAVEHGARPSSGTGREF